MFNDLDLSSFEEDRQTICSLYLSSYSHSQHVEMYTQCGQDPEKPATGAGLGDAVCMSYEFWCPLLLLSSVPVGDAVSSIPVGDTALVFSSKI